MSILKSIFSLFPPAGSGMRRIGAVEAAHLVGEGKAVLVDVREPAEWESGVAKSAQLLPFSDLTGRRRRWAPFLKRVGEREIILYCHSGSRCSLVGRMLAREGFKAASMGSFRAWAGADLPVTRPETAR